MRSYPLDKIYSTPVRNRKEETGKSVIFLALDGLELTMGNLEGGSSFDFSLIELSRHFLFDHPGGLSCQKADIDFVAVYLVIPMVYITLLVLSIFKNFMTMSKNIFGLILPHYF